MYSFKRTRIESYSYIPLAMDIIANNNDMVWGHAETEREIERGRAVVLGVFVSESLKSFPRSRREWQNVF